MMIKHCSEPARAMALFTTLLIALALSLPGCKSQQPAGTGTGPNKDASADNPAKRSRPNIVLIMADDMGFSDLGSYGSQITTTNLDRLAMNGLRFTQFYNAARCCPTRASLMTGLFPHQAGIGHMLGKSPNGLYQGDLGTDCVTLAEALGNSGYATYMSGKWHLTPWTKDGSAGTDNWPRKRGFDKFYGTLTSIRSYYNPPSLARDDAQLPTPSGDFHYTDAINKNAVQFINDHKSDKPFFLYVAHTAPHWPAHARPEDINRYKGKYADGWDLLREKRHRRLIELGLIEARWQLPPRDEQTIPWADVKPEYRAWFDHRMAVYAAMIEQMDRGIGQIIDALKRKDKFENTLIVFLSDNGGCAEEIGPNGRASNFPLKTRDGGVIRLGNDPTILPGGEDTYATYGLEWANASNTPFRRFKSFVHEGGIATPMIAHWPKNIRSGTTHQVAHIIDLMPTFLELARGVYPVKYKGRDIRPTEGKSLVPIFKGSVRKGHNALFWEHEGNRAVRQGDWKLVSKFPSDWELYNLAADRLETRNLATRMPDRVRQLETLYATWAKHCGVKPWVGRQTPIGWPDKDRYTR